MSDTVSVETVASAIDALRDQVPLVQSLTNIVSANFLTNVLLAAGASNAHIDNVHEAGGFAAVAGGIAAGDLGLYAMGVAATRVPWFVIGILHALECSFSFDKHLFNGDPLSDYTKRYPPGYPKDKGPPPFSFNDSAISPEKPSLRNA